MPDHKLLGTMAVQKALRRFRIHERANNLGDHLYPNRAHSVAICDVSRDSRRERKPIKHDHTGVKEPNDGEPTVDKMSAE